MQKLTFFIIVLSAFSVAIALYIGREESVKYSIKYFPLDEELQFVEANTKLKLLSEKDDDEYILTWETLSTLKKPIYLRQDISLLFNDGRLIAKQSYWKENEEKLSLSKKIKGEDSSHYQAITFHHGEIHYPDDNIKSIQLMTFDDLYVIDSPMTPLEAFRKPEDIEQEEWKNVLDHAMVQQLKYSWKKLIMQFNIPAEKYYQIPLINLHHYNDNPLPGFDNAKSQQIVGNLWEGLYKNYFLGINISKDSTEDSIGSSIPLILLSKDSTHLLILVETKSGKLVQLLQYIK